MDDMNLFLRQQYLLDKSKGQNGSYQRSNIGEKDNITQLQGLKLQEIAYTYLGILPVTSEATKSLISPPFPVPFEFRNHNEATRNTCLE